MKITKKSSRPLTSQFQMDANTESTESIFALYGGLKPGSEQAAVVVVVDVLLDPVVLTL